MLMKTPICLTRTTLCSSKSIKYSLAVHKIGEKDDFTSLKIVYEYLGHGHSLLPTYRIGRKRNDRYGSAIFNDDFITGQRRQKKKPHIQQIIPTFIQLVTLFDIGFLMLK